MKKTAMRRIFGCVMAAALMMAEPGASAPAFAAGQEDTGVAAQDFGEDLMDLLGGGTQAQTESGTKPRGGEDRDTQIQPESDTQPQGGEDLMDLLGGGTQIQSESETQPQTEPPVYPQLTAQDIVRLDEGDAELIYNKEGNVTFLRGRYSPDKVYDMEDAAESLNYISTLLGMTKGSLLFCVYRGIDYTTGYTYYLFLQRDGDVTVLNASIKIYVDPEGYTAAVSCSFHPETGIRRESLGKITAQEAEQVVRTLYGSEPNSVKIYEEATSQVGIMQNNRNYHVWSVYTNNPDMARGITDQPYLQHFVSYDGVYLMNLPCATVDKPILHEDDALEKRAKARFEGYVKDSWTGDVLLHDGSTMHLTIPVAYSETEDRYYLMDLDRLMMVADYREAVFGSGEYIISSSEDNSGWDDRELLAMYNIGRAYDYYADHGLRSVDGYGIPLLILSGVCDADGTPVDNAFFSGFMDGFGVFAISDINNSVECLDIMAHEFTHGITSYTMGGSCYVNAMGAINEAFSDIMGNLCELTWAANESVNDAGTGGSDNGKILKPDWRIGEMGGKVYRDMSDPVIYRQPAFAGDAYYCLPTENSSMAGNDYGGVHENSSLLGSIACVLNERGLTYEQQYSLWMTAANMMTPESEYADVLQALIFARMSYGFDEKIHEWLTEAFAQRGLLKDQHSESGKLDGVTFEEYNAQYLVSDAQQGQTEQEQLSQKVQTEQEQLSQKVQTEQTQQESEQSSLLDMLDDAFDARGGPDAVAEGEPGQENESPGWLKGVSLDAQGKITREGFGRIGLQIPQEERSRVIGALILEPFTYDTAAVNCPDENGNISFLIPEGTWWVVLCIGNGSTEQIQHWVYTQSGTYKPMESNPLFGLVEVSADKEVRLSAELDVS